MTSRIIYYFISVLLIYMFAIGACIYIIHNEDLSKKVIRICKAIIVVDVTAILVFLVLCIFKMENTGLYNWILISEGIAFLIVILEIIMMIRADIKGAHNRPKLIPRETFDLEEEFINEDNIKFCYTQKKNEEGYKGTIVFMHPDYYKCDLNGRVWYLDRRKKILLGHTGKYDEISDYFVRAGYHTVRYDHSDINAEIPIQPVLQRLSNVLQEKNAGKIIVFCAGNINNFMQEIVEGLNPTELICVGVTNQNALEYINSLKERIPVFIGDFGDDPYCIVKNENAIHFENTDFTFCVRGKRKLKKYGRSADNEGITDVAALDGIKEWLTEQD